MNPSAERYAYLTYDQVVTRNLRATDLTAITLCKEQGIPIHVFALDRMLEVFDTEGIGTRIGK